MNIQELEPLAKTIAAQGFPFLAKILGSVLPFPFNLAANAILSELGSVLGTPADPTAINNAIVANPAGLNDKLQAIEDKYKAELDFANLQVSLDTKEAESHSFFIAGWRPTFAWLCIVAVAYQMVSQTVGFPSIPNNTFNPIWMAFGGLLGLRSTEKWIGVARETLPRIFRGKR